MVAEEVTVCLSGGAPWGFRLQGGAEHQKPLQVAKVRRRSKACRAGLKEDDELVAIEEQPCTELSHAQAMNLIDMQSSTLHLKVKRGSSLSPLSPPAVALLPSWGPRCITSPPDSEAYYGETDSDADTQTPTLHRMRPRRTPPHPRSPARHDSQEADTETSEMSGYESAPDGGVSMQGHAWEQGPHQAALTNGTSLLPGVPRREVVYQPPQNHEEEWGVTSSSAHTPHTPTPGDQAGALLPGEGEEHDSGFQEAGAYVVASAVPLVSPERANEARMLGSASQLVPMVGPQHGPVSDELSTTYREKARQAKLQRGESVVEKQVKEARTKCRSIASLLTDAPNPNSKGVLMFKKRRQRAKKYTLTCFGKAEGLDAGTETEGETGTETEEEGGSSFLSGSEVDEDGFSAGFDSTWDTGYLETLDRRSSACPSSSTPATPTTNHGLGLDTSSSSAYQSPGFAHLSPGSEYAAGVDGSSWAHPGLRSSEATTNGWDQPVGGAGPYRNNNPAPMSPPAVSMYNGGPSVAVARANVILSPPASTAPPEHSEPHQNHYPGPANPAAMNPDLDYPGGNLNRTARPFTPGPAGLSRSSVAPVLFRPPQPRPASAAAGSVTAATSRPAAAVSMVNMTPPPRQQQPQESRRAVSSASLYISPRNGHGGSSVYSPPASLASAPSFSHPPANNNNPQPFTPEQRAVQAAPFSPPPPPHAQPLSPTTQGPPAYPSPAQTFTPHPPASSGMYAPPAPPPSQPPAAPAQAYAPAPQQAYAPAPQQAYAQAPQQAYAPAPQQQAYAPAPQQAYAPAPQQAYAPAPQQAYAPAPQPGPPPPPPPQLFNPYTNMAAPPPANQQPPPTAASSDSLASREQRVSVPASRTGILAEARRRSQQKKPMFCSVQNKDISPNPALLSMLQNMDRDSPPPTCPASFANGGHNNGLNNANNASEAGHDSGPEDDWLRLGAEACNFMQAQKGPRPPPVAPKPHQAPQPAPPPPPQLGGKGGQLFARRQSRMDSYERSPSVASVAPPYSPAQPRDASPTPSLPGAWKYNSTCRAPPPINYNPLLSPSCPLKAQKTPQKTAAAAKAAPGKGKGKNVGISAVDIMSHQPYQLNASLFTYGGGVPQNTVAPSQAAPGAKTARVREVRRFSTPPPTSTGPSLKVIAPRSATTLGEPLWRSNDDDSHANSAPAPAPAPYQAYQPQVSAAALYQPQPQWGPAASTPLSPPPPAPTAPLPQLPTFSYPGPPTFTHLQQATDARQFKSSPDLSPLVLNSAPSRPGSSMGVPRVPRPRFSTSNLGLQPCVWRPGSNMN